MNNPEPKPPSIFTMVSTFAKELKNYIANGAPNVSTEDYIERLEACNNCEHLIKTTMRCGLCGCLLEHKAKWRTTECPKNKWPKEYTEDLKNKEVDDEE